MTLEIWTRHDCHPCKGWLMNMRVIENRYLVTLDIHDADEDPQGAHDRGVKTVPVTILTDGGDIIDMWYGASPRILGSIEVLLRDDLMLERSRK